MKARASRFSSVPSADGTPIRFEGTAHYLMLEDPARFGRALDQALAQVRTQIPSAPPPIRTQ